MEAQHIYANYGRKKRTEMGVSAPVDPSDRLVARKNAPQKSKNFLVPDRHPGGPPKIGLMPSNTPEKHTAPRQDMSVRKKVAAQGGEVGHSARSGGSGRRC